MKSLVGKEKPMSVIRVVRDGDAWSVSGLSPLGASAVCSIDDMDESLRSNLSVLLTAPVEFYDQAVGRRVDEDIFWVYTKEE